jgi:hypothetical protein
MGSPFNVWKSRKLHAIGLVIGFTLSWIILSLVYCELFVPDLTLELLLMTGIATGIYGIFVFSYPFIAVFLVVSISNAIQNQGKNERNKSNNLP